VCPVSTCSPPVLPPAPCPHSLAHSPSVCVCTPDYLLPLCHSRSLVTGTPHIAGRQQNPFGGGTGGSTQGLELAEPGGSNT
jgi:hypothetical protein